jgi:triosephosphate isomerase
MRKTIIAGNWKMNKTSKEALNFIDELSDSIKMQNKIETIICPTYVCLDKMSDKLKNYNIKLGAQNMYWEKSGAFTGEVSGEMLKDLGCEYVIIGHSERRQLFFENDITVNLKVKKALEIGLRPIMCVGETLHERENNKTDEIISLQIENGLRGLNLNGKSESLVIAYEPVWAIGTGKTCKSEEANRVISLIRNILKKNFGSTFSESVRILYGGSVKPENIKELVSMPDIDGGLVGGASLDAKSFEKLVENVM